ncbi:hypothetical protein SUGI_0608700 [Cryptomeria japonica]|nr:uncharacterized protein LOC131071440 isoform X2 [Cryptomeria japonica]XP_057863257.1 uncharacterized protein LOC131071440 isoform X2 [Cryptomeria japonica]XP_057863258.1 uncharacterized protein LOC131071440 isoform X2 [Cryptomeria japonica]GLJ30712.1 hypothetical protein SUGI_0608700 [Cryptomeria japonica]
MSRTSDRSIAMFGDKRTKVQKTMWRPVNALSHSPEGKKNEDTNVHIKITQRENSSVANAKHWIVVNDNRKPSDSNIASNLDIENSNQDLETKSETKPIKSFIAVKHIKSEDSVKCIKPNQESLAIEPIILTNPEDISSSEQEVSLAQSEASVKSVQKSHRGVIMEVITSDHKDFVENKKQKIEEDIDSTILQNCTAAEESVETSRLSSTIKVDAALLRFVKGKGGKVQQKIEETTGVKISFKSTKDESAVVLDGPSSESVNIATTIIQKMLDEAVKGRNLQYSHFISLPLAVHPALVEKLTNFQTSILALSGYGGKEVIDSESSSTAESSEDDGEEVCKVETSAHPADKISDVKEAVAVKFNIEDENAVVKSGLKEVSSGGAKSNSQAKKNLGIDKSIFIKPAMFHLTVLMLKLWNKERVAVAAEVLQKVSSQLKEALEDCPVAVSLKGLEIMRGKPAKAHVLYAPVEEVGGGDCLQRACRVIIDAFVEAGLVMEKDATSALKLHATLMNTSHRKMKKSKRDRRNLPFDARPVMELYGSENWGQYVIHEAHLSQRFKYDDNGYYHCCSSIPFPKVNISGDDTYETTKEIAETIAQEMSEACGKEDDADTKEEINQESAGSTAKEDAKGTDMRAI